MKAWRSVDPSTGELIEEFAPTSEADARKAVEVAHRAFLDWKAASFDERAGVLHKVAEILEAEHQRLAQVITREMGKPITEAEAEVKKCAFGCTYFADHAEGFLADESLPSDSPRSKVVFEPLGVVLSIMPWNFPFWQVYRFAAPALMAGNAVALKHASAVGRCALEIQDIFKRAGTPDGLFQALFVDREFVEELIAHPQVQAVTLTGSDRAGSSVASLAGKHLKKTVLELGGSDPFIVLADAEVASAAITAVDSRFQNTGQSCIAAKRFILEKSIAGDFSERLVEAVEELVVGDPMDRATQVGPLAREDLRDNLHRQVTESVEAGATVVTGGEPMDRAGFFYRPTVLTGVTADMPVMREETFGPVAALVEVEDADRAVDVANDTEFGLGGNVWTANLEAGRALASRIVTGSVFINGMTHSDPRLPFGGVKRSGWGRELSSYGIKEFTNIKTIWEPGDVRSDG